MNELWQNLEEHFNNLSVREKYLVLVCGLVAVVMILFTMVLEPKLDQVNSQQKQLASAKQANQQLEIETLKLRAQLKKDPNAAVDAAIGSLMEESQYLSEQMAGIIEVLVTPSKMAQLLESVLQDEKDITLVSLETLPAEPVAKNAEAAQYAGYYVHPVKMVIEGNYFSITRYLKRLENIPLGYFWRDFSYTVEEYPKAKLVIEVYTLGAREEFIGG